MHPTTFTRVLRQLTLALLLAGAGASAAAAAPAAYYHVDIDTRGLSGAGYLDFTFLAGNSTAPASATLSRFSGALGGVVAQEGDVQGSLAGGLDFGSASFHNELFQSIALGGKFSFDVRFGGAFLLSEGNAATTFGVGLLDDSAYLGNPDGDMVRFELLPRVGASPAGVGATSYAALATISAVPEADTWLMLSAGLGLLAWSWRRRRAAVA
ncbi:MULTISPECIES: NF038129 family PEP-CTERM protein [unclassified Janthinobacterium]|uniref:NF038129 family PEP-CTERM protein n=1 Tax=unclassified Janthinobacterium TaxID=2610881 RepID=UPI0003457C97|nr:MULTISPECIES: NF038129 family PEP-CTERM protein [unclassified Janthinobacterium]MEC5163369.1 hypothetical protein [Janthinobacterium sp. CG_S6]